MKTPESLETLVEYGIIEEVVRPLMSGKEAQIYLVVTGGEEAVAKVYKEATQRTFKHRVAYTEGRRTRNSRDQRAVSKRTRHGRQQDEAAWRTAEVDMIYRLRDAGVRVPEPINFVEGVLVMELVKDAQGDPAPRLGDLSFDAGEAYPIYKRLIQDVVRMLCAGVIHGDLSEFNVLMSADGPVLIDFPQAVDPAHNQGARTLLLRDVENLHRFLERFSPGQPRQPYAQEMWSLYQANRLLPDTELGGTYRAPEGKANTDEVLALIDDADFEEQERRDARGVETPVKHARHASSAESRGSAESVEPVKAPKPLRAVVDFTHEARPRSRDRKRAEGERGGRPKQPRKRAAKKPVSTGTAAGRDATAQEAGSPKKRRGRRRHRSGAAASGEMTPPTSGRDSAPAGAKPAPKTAGIPAADGSRGSVRSAGTAGSDGRTRSKGRRRARGGRTGALSKPGEAKAKAKPEGQGHETRPAQPAAGARSGGRPPVEAGGSDRPARRRRRRRPRAATSRETP